MGIGIQAIGLLEEILEKKQFNNCKTLIELGSQDIDSNLAKKLLVKRFFRFFKYLINIKKLLPWK